MATYALDPSGQQQTAGPETQLVHMQLLLSRGQDQEGLSHTAGHSMRAEPGRGAPLPDLDESVERLAAREDATSVFPSTKAPAHTEHPEGRPGRRLGELSLRRPDPAVTERDARLRLRRDIETAQAFQPEPLSASQKSLAVVLEEGVLAPEVASAVDADLDTIRVEHAHNPLQTTRKGLRALFGQAQQSPEAAEGAFGMDQEGYLKGLIGLVSTLDRAVPPVRGTHTGIRGYLVNGDVVGRWTDSSDGSPGLIETVVVDKGTVLERYEQALADTLMRASQLQLADREVFLVHSLQRILTSVPLERPRTGRSSDLLSEKDPASATYQTFAAQLIGQALGVETRVTQVSTPHEDSKPMLLVRLGGQWMLRDVHARRQFPLEGFSWPAKPDDRHYYPSRERQLSHNKYPLRIREPNDGPASSYALEEDHLTMGYDSIHTVLEHAQPNQ